MFVKVNLKPKYLIVTHSEKTKVVRISKINFNENRDEHKFCKNKRCTKCKYRERIK